MYTYADDTREAGGMMIGNHVRFYDENYCVEEERLPGELRQAAQRRSHRAIDNASSDLPRVTGRQSQQQLVERGFEPSTAALTPSTPVQRLSAGQPSMDVASASLLEIPPQLAYVFSKLDEWQAEHTERHLANVDGVTPRLSHRKLPADIDRYQLTEYRDKYCKDTLCVLSATPSNSSFLSKLEAEDASESLMINKLVYRYVFDSTLTGKRQRVVADFIVYYGLANAALRDEIYVQLCNLTFLSSVSAADSDRATVRRTWQLMAHCLSSFKPSNTLHNYLLKYVSDHAFDGYKSYCQHKLLDGPEWAFVIPRAYPPSLLECSATAQRLPIALQAEFADGYTLVGHVDSWLTCEEFVCQLLTSRQVTSSQYGWTVALHDGRGSFECAGHDYMMDVIGEKDLAPGFPVCNTDMLGINLEQLSSRSQSTDYYGSQPHVTERDYAELSQLVPVPSELQWRSAAASNVGDRRPPSHGPPAATDGLVLLGNSALNARYMSDQQQMPGIPAGAKFRTLRGGHQARLPADDGGSRRGARRHGADEVTMTSGMSDMDRWLERVFDHALDGTVDELDDERALSGRLKGGGDNPNQPARSQQRVILNAPTANHQQQLAGMNSVPSYASPVGAQSSSFIAPTLNTPGSMTSPGVAAAAMPAPAFSSPVTGSIPVGRMPMPMTSSLTAEQMLQQQTLQQQQWQLQRENVALQALLDAQQRQNELLKQSLQQQQPLMSSSPHPSSLQATGAAPVTVSHLSPASFTPTVVTVGDPRPPTAIAPAAWTTRRAPVSHAAASSPPTRDVNTQNAVMAAEDSAGTRSWSTSHDIQRVHVEAERSNDVVDAASTPHQNLEMKVVSKPPDMQPSAAVSLPAPPPPAPQAPPPPPQPSHQVAAPPIVPPPAAVPPAAAVARPTPAAGPPRRHLPPTQTPDDMVKERPIRVGKIQWPPPRADEPKPAVQVGRLDIEESDDVNSRLNADVVRQRIHEKIVAASPNQPSSASTQPPSQTTSAETSQTSRQQQQLPQHHELRDDHAEKDEQRVSSEMKRRQDQLHQQLAAKQSSNSPSSSPAVVRSSASAQLHQPAPPPTQPTQPTAGRSNAAVETTRRFDLHSLDQQRTVLHDVNNAGLPFLTYSGVQWIIRVRKEVLFPLERLDDALIVDLVYAQIVTDVFRGSMRISSHDTASVRAMLDGQKVHPSSILTDQVSEAFKKTIINTARSWPIYFSRLYSVSGGRQHPDVSLLSVSHTGIRLISQQQQQQQRNNDLLQVLRHVKYEELLDVSVPRSMTLQIHTSSNYIVLYTQRAEQIRNVIEAFFIESDENAQHVKAIRHHKAQDASQLNFSKGDIVTLSNRDADLQRGYLRGAAHGSIGMFSSETVVPVQRARISTESTSSLNTHASELISDSAAERGSVIGAKNRHTMLEFALLHFRNSPYRLKGSHANSSSLTQQAVDQITSARLRNGGSGDSWTWQDQVDLVKWSRTPIQASLLKLDSSVNKIAVESFVYLMRYMGDLDASQPRSDNDMMTSVWKIITASCEHPSLADEVYCQIVKQLTNNRSTRSDSCQLGWRLLTLVTSYCQCSEALGPYLTTFLEQTANDERRANYMLAAACIRNLRQTFKYGGRQTLPSKVEVLAATQGKSASQMVISLPGGVPVRITVFSSTVVKDAVDQICDVLEVHDPSEREEYTLYIITNSASVEHFPEHPTAYLFDVIKDTLSRTKDFYLLVQRTGWYFPLHLDSGNQTYINMMYQQIRPDLLDGTMLVVPNKTLSKALKEEISHLAALQMRISDLQKADDDVDMFIPKTVLQFRDVKKSSWSRKIATRLEACRHLSPFECQVQFLQILSTWPLGWSIYYDIKKVSGLPKGVLASGECMLAVNRNGLVICTAEFHEPVESIPLHQLMSVKCIEQRGANVLEVKRASVGGQSTSLQLLTSEAEHIEAIIALYVTLMKASAIYEQH